MPHSGAGVHGGLVSPAVQRPRLCPPLRGDSPRTGGKLDELHTAGVQPETRQKVIPAVDCLDRVSSLSLGEYVGGH